MWSLYDNLIEGMLLNDKNQVWQSDITYFDIENKFYYLVFIMDIYTKQILGWTASDHMKTQANLQALQQAFASQPDVDLTGLIHHSDRGSQYVDEKYRSKLQGRGIWISMGNTAVENAYVERLNGIIKNEFLKGWKITGLKQLNAQLKRAVEYYNNHRIHRNLPGKLTPNQFAWQLPEMKKRPVKIVYSNKNPGLKDMNSNMLPSACIYPGAPFCPWLLVNKKGQPILAN